MSGPVGLADTNSTSTRSGARGCSAEVVAGIEQRGDALAMPPIRKEHVDEARARHLDPLGARSERSSAPPAAARRRRGAARPEPRREQHRRVGRVVAHLGLRRPLERGRDASAPVARGHRPPIGSSARSSIEGSAMGRILDGGARPPPRPPAAGGAVPAGIRANAQARHESRSGRADESVRGCAVLAAVGEAAPIRSMVEGWVPIRAVTSAGGSGSATLDRARRRWTWIRAFGSWVS